MIHESEFWTPNMYHSPKSGLQDSSVRHLDSEYHSPKSGLGRSFCLGTRVPYGYDWRYEVVYEVMYEESRTNSANLVNSIDAVLYAIIVTHGDTCWTDIEIQSASSQSDIWTRANLNTCGPRKSESDSEIWTCVIVRNLDLDFRSSEI